MKPLTAFAVMVVAAVAFGLLFALILEATTPTPPPDQLEMERLRKLSELWDEHQKAEQRAFQARLEGKEGTSPADKGNGGLNYFLPEKLRQGGGHQAKATPPLPPPAEDKAYCRHFEQLPKKYLSFEPWPGGWNNRRLSLECLLVLSLVSGRTLILPAYNFNVPDEHIQGAIMLSYDTAYDMDLLKQYFNVVTMDEFVRCGSESVLKALAYRPTSCDKTYEGTKDRFFCESSKLVSSRAKFAQFDGGTFFQIPHDWNTRDPKGHGRRPTGFPDEHLGVTILHYQRNVLSCFSNMLYIRSDVKAIDRVAPNMPSPFAEPTARLKAVSPNETMRHAVFGRIRDGLQYNKDIRTLAAKIVEELGGVDQFSCVHLRRKDFKLQYPDTVGDPAQVLYNLRSLLKPGERILLSTDDEHEVVEALTRNATASGLNIQWKVWSQLTTKMFDVNRIQIPLVCQEVCVSARLFAPNPHSTYSGLVVRRRGYRGALGAYYTTVRIDAESNPRSLLPDNLPDEAGPTWGHETSHGWVDLD